MKIINRYILMGFRFNVAKALGTVALLLLIGVVIGCGRGRTIKPSGKTVKIGVIAPLSGIDEDIGKSGLDGIEVALSVQAYLDNGDKIELVIEDDKSSPDETADAFDRLQEKEVAGILFLSRSSSALQMVKKNRWMKIPVVMTIATHPQLMDYSPYITQLSFDDAFQGSVAAMFMRDELLLERALVVSNSEDAHSTFLAQKFIARFESTHGVVVEHVVLSSHDMPLYNQLELARSKRAQLIYAPVQAESVLSILRILKELSWKPVVMTSDGLLSEMLLTHKDDLAMVDGVMATDMHSSILERTEFGEDVEEEFYAQKRKRGSTFTILGSEGVAVLMEALSMAAPPYDAKDVQESLGKIRNFEGFSGTLSIGEDGKVIRPVYVNVIKGDKLELMVKVY
ncbi:MAG: ABC transporter substrate-binding protein [Kiritimatiellae bacterium]|nr:ABC transporter substrate-binding protein [Kiritimatiellia bacterium]